MMIQLTYRQWLVSGVASGLLLLGLAAPALAASDAEVAELRRAMLELRAQNQELARRLSTLEGGTAAARQRQRPTTDTARRVPGLTPPVGDPPDPAAVAPAAPAPFPQPLEARPAPIEPGRRLQTNVSPELLEQRVRELEIGQAARDSATRSIIQNALSSLGSNINQFVSLSGAVEVRAGQFRDFTGPSRDSIELNTAELDFDIRLNEWATGSVIVSYDPGNSILFPSTDGFETRVDRINLDRATITIGDEFRFPIYFRAGRDVVPFGTSTGLARVDTLSLAGPLTTDGFESRQDSVGFGFSFPTPALQAVPPPVVIPRVEPLLISPLINSFAKRIGFNPALARPSRLLPTQGLPVPPPIYGSVYVFNGNPELAVNRRVSQNISASLGYRTEGTCGRSFEELRDSWVCPWSFDVRADYNSSVFDSTFLSQTLRPFLGQIGDIPGLAVSLRASSGPFAFVGEVNTAIRTADFLDDSGRRQRMNPAAWQASLAYQFGWNPWIEKIGEQGNFVAVSYSGTSDFAGVTQLLGGIPTRVGSLPQSRVALTAGEWVLDGVKFTTEVAMNWDYSKADGGTGNTSLGIFSAVILNF